VDENVKMKSRILETRFKDHMFRIPSGEGGFQSSRAWNRLLETMSVRVWCFTMTSKLSTVFYSRSAERSRFPSKDRRIGMENRRIFQAVWL